MTVSNSTCRLLGRGRRGKFAGRRHNPPFCNGPQAGDGGAFPTFAKSAASYDEATMIFAGGKLMSNMSRAILASLTAAIITFVLTVVIAAIIDYAWVHGSSDPSRVDTLAWMFIYIWPFLVIQLFIPAIIVGIVAAIFPRYG